MSNLHICTLGLFFHLDCYTSLWGGEYVLPLLSPPIHSPDVARATHRHAHTCTHPCLRYSPGKSISMASRRFWSRVQTPHLGRRAAPARAPAALITPFLPPWPRRKTLPLSCLRVLRPLFPPPQTRSLPQPRSALPLLPVHLRVLPGEALSPSAAAGLAPRRAPRGCHCRELLRSA